MPIAIPAMTADQAAALQQLKTKLEGKLTDRHDDISLIRFLRVKSFDVVQTAEMVLEDIVWRENLDLDAPDLAAAFAKRNPHFQAVVDHWPGGFMGKDKYGLPVLYERPGRVDFGAIFQHVSQEQLVDIHIFYQELSRRAEQEAIANGAPSDGLLLVQDIGDIGLKHMMPQVFMFLREIAIVDRAHFPDLFRSIVLINVPMIFSGFWTLIKPIFDWAVNKIELIGSGLWSAGHLPRLQADTSIDDIPVWCGGKNKQPMPEGGVFTPAAPATPAKAD